MEQNKLSLWLAFAVALFTAIMTAMPLTILALATYREAESAKIQSAATHDVVNSRMSEMIKLVEKAAGDAATLAEKKAQHQREGEAAIEERETK